MDFLKGIWKAVNNSKTKIGAALYAAGEAINEPILQTIGTVLIVLGGGHAAIKSARSVKEGNTNKEE